ncbi:MAG TPA: GNAT family N-acetyltransferase [Ktedonobacterales bacterium]
MDRPEAQISVVDNTVESRYETRVDGDLAILTYDRDDDRIALLHTEVPPRLEGRGIAGALARFALEAARAQGLMVIPSCPYVAAYIRRHPDYLPLVEPRWRSVVERRTRGG